MKQHQYIVIDKITWVDSGFDDSNQTGFIEIHLLDKSSVRIDFDNEQDFDKFLGSITSNIPSTIEINHGTDAPKI